MKKILPILLLLAGCAIHKPYTNASYVFYGMAYPPLRTQCIEDTTKAYYILIQDSVLWLGTPKDHTSYEIDVYDHTGGLIVMRAANQYGSVYVGIQCPNQAPCKAVIDFSDNVAVDDNVTLECGQLNDWH